MDEKKILIENSINPTPIRIQIIKLLLESDRPLSCNEFVEFIDVNKTTIYRNLSLLEERGLLISTESNRTVFYELKSEARAYFVCDKCHKIEKVEMPKFEKKHINSVKIQGVCDECYE